MKTNTNEIVVPTKLKLEVVHEFELTQVTNRADMDAQLLADEPHGPQFLLRDTFGNWLVPVRLDTMVYRTVCLSGFRSFNVARYRVEAPEWTFVSDVPEEYEVWQIKYDANPDPM